ncbi:hypothetical protein [Nitrospira lenta]|nr:hypothetical protein [Nitrospira lenta]
MHTGPSVTVRLSILLCTLLSCSVTSVEQADAVGPVAYRDCSLSWNPNAESDLAGYRLYLGRSANRLDRMMDIGLRTSIRCSDVGAAANGQWFGTVTAYDHNGNESAPAQAVPFEIAGWPDPALSTEILEPSSTRFVNTPLGALLVWDDLNAPLVSHRVEIASSLTPTWTTAIVQPPGVPTFSYFQMTDAEWVCYRVRGERGALVSDWAKAGGPDDKQFCAQPTPLTTIEQPILAPTILDEPESARLTAFHHGFTLSWGHPDALTGPSYRIEVSGSLDLRWTPLALLPPGANEFRYYRALDAEWVCLRVRAEVGRAVSLWAVAGGPNDRQICFKPYSPIPAIPSR